MPPVSYQTIKLSRGKHSSSEHGACVMELASMLAGEPFTDRPRSVSRPIGAFLRGYNDLLDDRRRQDLYAYASRAVGTAASASIENARAARLLAWGDELWEVRSGRSLLDRLRAHRARRERPTEAEPAGAYAVHALGKVSDEMHQTVLALIDELIGIGTRRRPDRPLPAISEEDVALRS